jgi:hypothetical protein
MGKEKPAPAGGNSGPGFNIEIARSTSGGTRRACFAAGQLMISYQVVTSVKTGVQTFENSFE